MSIPFGFHPARPWREGYFLYRLTGKKQRIKEYITKGRKSMFPLKKASSSKTSRQLSILAILLAGLLPLTANATLLGRLNNYYSDQKQAVPTDEINLLLKQKELMDKKAALANGANATEGENKKALEKIETKLERIEYLLKLHDAVKASLEDIKKAVQAKEQAMAAGTGVQTTQDNVEKSLAALEQSNKKLKDAENVEHSRMIVDETTYGIQEGLGAATVINSNKNTSVALNAYRYNLILGPKKGGCEKNEEGNDLCKYKSIPMYIFLKKTLNSKVDKDTVTDDLLDNELGGTVHIKISGGKTTLGSWTASHLVSFEDAEVDPKMKNYGTKWIFDAGVKLIEAPAIPVAGATETTDTAWIGAGYIGAGLNFEFPIFAPNGNGGSDTRQYIAPGTKPAGGLAFGLGAYRNFAGANQFDNSKFSRPVPKAYSTYALMFEMQITNLLSVKGTRTLATSGSNPLGHYTSFQVGYKFE